MAHTAQPRGTVPAKAASVPLPSPAALAPQLLNAVRQIGGLLLLLLRHRCRPPALFMPTAQPEPERLPCMRAHTRPACLRPPFARSAAGVGCGGPQRHFHPPRCRRSMGRSMGHPPADPGGRWHGLLGVPGCGQCGRHGGRARVCSWRGAHAGVLHATHWHGTATAACRRCSMGQARPGRTCAGAPTARTTLRFPQVAWHAVQAAAAWCGAAVAQSAGALAGWAATGGQGGAKAQAGAPRVRAHRSRRVGHTGCTRVRASMCLLTRSWCSKRTRCPAPRPRCRRHGWQQPAAGTAACRCTGLAPPGHRGWAGVGGLVGVAAAAGGGAVPAAAGGVKQWTAGKQRRCDWRAWRLRCLLLLEG